MRRCPAVARGIANRVGLRICTLDDPGWFKPDVDVCMKSGIVNDYCDARLAPTSVMPPISRQIHSRAGPTELDGDWSVRLSVSGMGRPDIQPHGGRQIADGGFGSSIRWRCVFY